MVRLGLNPRVLTSVLMLQSFSFSDVVIKRTAARYVPRRSATVSELWRSAAFSAPFCPAGPRQDPGQFLCRSSLFGEQSAPCWSRMSIQHTARRSTRGMPAGFSFRMLAEGRDRGQRGASRRDVRLFLEGNHLELGAQVDFSEAQSHYLRKVMRVSEGGEIKVFDGSTGEWWCKIDFFGKKSASGTITEQRRSMVQEPDVWVVFAAVKGDAADTIVQKATELGAAQIVPIITQRVAIVKALRRERLNMIAVEAAEQPLKELLAAWPSDRRLILCDETSDGAPLQALASVEPGTPAAVVIGPEGGWTGEELEQLRSVDGMVSISLGPRILRADTAVLAALALYQAASGDWQHTSGSR